MSFFLHTGLESGLLGCSGCPSFVYIEFANSAVFGVSPVRCTKPVTWSPGTSRDDGMQAELCAQQTDVEELCGDVEGSFVVGVGDLLLPWMERKLAIVCLCVDGRQWGT